MSKLRAQFVASMAVIANLIRRPKGKRRGDFIVWPVKMGKR